MKLSSAGRALTWVGGVLVCAMAAPMGSVTSRTVQAQTLSPAAFSAVIEQLDGGDGAILYRVRSSSSRTPALWSFVQQMFDVVRGDKALPFGRSVALLVGVGDYRSLEDLKLVSNDITAFRDYLLNVGKFDDVYVLTERQATGPAIERFMMNRFRTSLSADDRLLFYWAGHAESIDGVTGYMQFAEAERGDFANHVLPISRTFEWSKVLPVRHALFIFDTCTAGLAFNPRGAEDSRSVVLSTLSGSGSRIVVTAGTDTEKTFEIQGARNGVFISALLKALDSYSNQGFVTINQAVAAAEPLVVQYALQGGVSRESVPHPRIQHLDDRRGTFVFVSTASRSGTLDPPIATILGFRPRSGRPGRHNPTDGLFYAQIAAGTTMIGCRQRSGAYLCRPSEMPVLERSFELFYLGATEVTVAAYLRFAAANGLEPPEPPFYNDGWRNRELPMVNVAWTDARAYCRWAGIGRGRLPSEAEWEYAARGGRNNQEYPWGDERASAARAVFQPAAMPSAVGSIPPNEYGLFDMAGNVSEWTGDAYRPNLSPTAVAQDFRRVVRGGSYVDGVAELRVAARRGFDENANATVGFRCVMSELP